MESKSITVVLSIPIPSTDPLFLAIVGVHIVFGLASVIAGAAAMLSNKGRAAATRISGQSIFGACSGCSSP